MGKNYMRKYGTYLFLKDLSWCHHIGHSQIFTVRLTKVRKIVVKIGHLALYFFAAFLADVHKKD